MLPHKLPLLLRPRPAIGGLAGPAFLGLFGLAEHSHQGLHVLEFLTGVLNVFLANCLRNQVMPLLHRVFLGDDLFQFQTFY